MVKDMSSKSICKPCTKSTKLGDLKHKGTASVVKIYLTESCDQGNYTRGN